MSASDPDFDARERRDEVDVAGTLSALARRKGLIAGATVGCAAAALAFCLVVKPRYIAEARVIVEDQETFYTRPDPASRGESGSQLIDAEAINSQIQLVSSRDLARKAVSALQLQKLPEFDPAPSGPLALLSLLTGGGKASEDRLLNNYFDHLQVLSPTKSRILQIEFSSRDPDLAANAANTIANLYIDLKQQAKRESAREAAQSLKPQIAELQQRVIEAEAKVADFRLANDLYDSAENSSLPTQQLADLATKLADARATQSEAMAKAKALRVLLSRNRLGDAGEISNNDLVRTIAARRSAVEAQLAAESRTLLSGHPKIKELQAQLYDLDMQLRTAVDKAARGLEHEAGVQETRVAELSRQLDEQKRNVGVANGVETRLRELQRQAKTLKDQLESESAKYQAAVGREKSENTPADARIVSRAVAPSTPAFPKKGPITLFGALAGLFFSSFYVIARETLGGGAPAPAPVAGGEQGRARRPLGARWSDALAGAAARLTGARAQVKDGPIDDHRPVQDRPVEVEPVEITAVQVKAVEDKAVEDKPVEVTPVQVKPVEDEPAENKPVPTNRLRAAWLGAFSKLKTVLAEFGAPAVKLDDPETLDIPQEKLEPATESRLKTAARAGVDGVWTRDPFALRTEAKPDFGVRRETLRASRDRDGRRATRARTENRARADRAHCRRRRRRPGRDRPARGLRRRRLAALRPDRGAGAVARGARHSCATRPRRTPRRRHGGGVRSGAAGPRPVARRRSLLRGSHLSRRGDPAASARPGRRRARRRGRGSAHGDRGAARHLRFRSAGGGVGRARPGSRPRSRRGGGARPSVHPARLSAGRFRRRRGAEPDPGLARLRRPIDGRRGVIFAAASVIVAA